MLPTPAKTPRKRRVEDVSSTARGGGVRHELVAAARGKEVGVGQDAEGQGKGYSSKVKEAGRPKDS